MREASKRDPNVLERPKYVGQGATELSKHVNAESVARHQEETNYTIPTLRQILKVDDGIPLGQMTKSQLCALPESSVLGTTRGLRLIVDRNAIRHKTSYRMI